MKRVNILFLSANPVREAPTAIDEESRKIRLVLATSKFKKRINFIDSGAVRVDDILDGLNRHKPHVVHFSGHGTQGEELVIVGNDGKAQRVSKESMTELFRTLKDNVRVVVLNACYTRAQAEDIAMHVDCVVGMEGVIGDEAARDFAAAFYRALAFGRSVKNAFDQGVTDLKLNKNPDANKPELLTRPGVKADEIVLINARKPLLIGTLVALLLLLILLMTSVEMAPRLVSWATHLDASVPDARVIIVTQYRQQCTPVVRLKCPGGYLKDCPLPYGTNPCSGFTLERLRIPGCELFIDIGDGFEPMEKAALFAEDKLEVQLNIPPCKGKSR